MSSLSLLILQKTLLSRIFFLFHRKNASRSWHARNLTASQTHMTTRSLPRRPTPSSRPAAAGEGSALRSTPRRMLSATSARSASEDECIHKDPEPCANSSGCKEAVCTRRVEHVWCLFVDTLKEPVVGFSGLCWWGWVLQPTEYPPHSSLPRWWSLFLN